MSFSSLGLSEPLLRAIGEQGYQIPTPIQAQAIPSVLSGRDVLGCAQTGTGKTAAFALPIIQRLAQGARVRAPRALVVSPTRELAQQIADDFRAYGRHVSLSGAVIYGGVSQVNQVSAMRRGPDILVATPGRLLDLIAQRHIDLAHVSVLVLDEADRMLDMGFLPDVRRIVAAVPVERQTLLFSATMPAEIAGLAQRLLRDPVHVSVTPPATTVEAVEQTAYSVCKEDKPALLVHLLGDAALSRVLVFTRTKHGADRLCQRLERPAHSAAASHRYKSQNARTGRATKSGEALSFVAPEEAAFMRDIEKTISRSVPLERAQPFHVEPSTPRASAPPVRGRQQAGRRHGGRRNFSR